MTSYLILTLDILEYLGFLQKSIVNPTQLIKFLGFLVNFVTIITVLIWQDNYSAVAYINHMGGTRSSMLASVAIEFWMWALQKDIILQACHMTGVDKWTADTQCPG